MVKTPPRSSSRRSCVPRTVPLPETVVLYNFVGPSANGNHQRWSRESYSANLLHQYRLDLVIPTREDEKEGGDESHTSKMERVLYSSKSATSVRPAWQHLDDHLDREKLSVEEYEGMKIRLSLVDDGEDHRPETSLLSDNNNSQNHVDKKKEPSGDNNSPTTSPVVLELPIHPSKMARVATLPLDLPFNSVVVTYTDHSCRLPPSLYQVLVDLGQESLVAVRDNDASFGSLGDPTFARFDSNVFSALDQVTPQQQSLLETDDERQATPVSGAILKINGDDDEMSSPDQGWIQDARQRQELLERRLLEEEEALEREVADLQKDKTRLESLLDNYTMVDDQIVQLQTATVQETSLCHESELFLESQRIRLFRELRSIYPIALRPDGHGYAIRDCQIPVDILTGGGGGTSTVPEEELAASLGYLAHLVTLMSKYLAVPLRYRIYCHSSRSAVRDDRGNVFPLFPAGRAAVERERLEQGVHLLDRDVECICRARGVPASSDAHILAKAQSIYDHIIEGS